MSWNTANSAILAEGRPLLIDDPSRFDGVHVIGVDEHKWRHVRGKQLFVTVIIDLTAVRDGTGPARLLDMVEGRSKKAFKQWLADRPPAWRDGIDVVAMDGFTGFKTADAEELPDAVAVMDPFHVVRLGADAMDRCRRRIHLDTCGRRGRKNDPLYGCRRTLLTGQDDTLLPRCSRPGRSIRTHCRVPPSRPRQRTPSPEGFDRHHRPEHRQQPGRDPHPEMPGR